MLCPECGRKISHVHLYSKIEVRWRMEDTDGEGLAVDSVVACCDTEDYYTLHVECPECEQDITTTDLGRSAREVWECNQLPEQYVDLM